MINHKNIVLTGASSGIGKAILELLAAPEVTAAGLGSIRAARSPVTTPSAMVSMVASSRA